MSEENLSSQTPRSINLLLILTVALLIGFASGLLAARSGPLTARVATTVINRCPHTLDINDEYILAGFICPNPADLIPLSGCHCTLAHQIMDRVKEERRKVQEKLKRLGKAFVDGVYDETDYQRQRRQLVLALESLVVPEADAAEEAGNLILQLPHLWEAASLSERRQLLLTMLDGVYVDAKDDRAIVALKPKPAFKALFQIATTKGASGVILYNEKALALSESSDDLCSWWRRGRVELYCDTYLRRPFPATDMVRVGMLVA